MAKRSVQQQDSISKAFSWMLLSAVGFSTMTYFVKGLSGPFPNYQIIFVRAFINWLGTLALMNLFRERFFGTFQPILVFRGLMGFGALTFFFLAIRWLPISVATLLNWGSPLFVMFFSPWVTGERYPRQTFAWVAIVLLGLAGLISPNLIHWGGTPLPWRGIAAGVLGALFSSWAYLAIRKASRTVSPNVIILYFTTLAAALSFPFAYTDWVWPTLPQWGQLVTMGLCATIGQYAMTQGYLYAPAGIVSTLMLMSAMFSSLYGLFFLGEQLGPLQWTGMALMGVGIAAVSQTRIKTQS